MIIVILLCFLSLTEQQWLPDAVDTQICEGNCLGMGLFRKSSFIVWLRLVNQSLVQFIIQTTSTYHAVILSKFLTHKTERGIHCKFTRSYMMMS